MITRLLYEQDIAEAAALIRCGEPVGMPTETVYGLGSSMDEAAVKKIFWAAS